MTRAVSRRRQRAGMSYAGLLMGTAITVLLVGALSMGLTHGTHLSTMTKTRTDVLNAAQEEMERVRGIPFSRLASYTVNTGTVSGSVTVEEPAARRKQVSIVLTSIEDANQTVSLATYVHQDGINQ